MSGPEQATPLAVGSRGDKGRLSMKSLTAIALLCALGTVAAAMPAPVERARPAVVLGGADISIGPSGAVRERDYFQAPQAQFNAGGFVCRLPLIVFDKTRLASSCH
jgi:hypothetical protein